MLRSLPGSQAGPVMEMGKSAVLTRQVREVLQIRKSSATQNVALRLVASAQLGYLLGPTTDLLHQNG